MRITSGFITACALLASVHSQASEVACVQRDRAISQLEQKFQEKVSGRGITERGDLMFELFVSEEGTWTMLASKPNGTSCAITTGEGWYQIALEVGERV